MEDRDRIGDGRRLPLAMQEFTRRQSARFFCAAFCMDFSSGVFVVALPYMAMRLGGGSLDLGSLGSVRGAYALVCITTSFLADRVNRRALIAASSLLITATFAGTGAVTRLSGLLAATFCWSVALAFYWPPFFAWFGHLHDRRSLGRSTAVLNMGWSAGLMLGTSIGGGLFEARTWMPFAIAAGGALAAGLLMLGAPSGKPPERAPATPAAAPGARRQLAAAWLANISSCTLLGLMGSIFPKLGETIGIGAARFGMLMGVLGAGRIAAFVFGFWGSGRMRDWRAPVLTQVLAAAAVATLCREEHHAWLAAVFGVVGVCLGATYFRGLYISLEGGGARGAKSGMHEAALVIGVLIGALGGGILAETDLRAPYVPIAILVGVFTAIQAALNLSAANARSRPVSAGPGRHPIP